MRLFVGVVGFGESFCDDEFGHVDLVLEKIGDGVFDVATNNIISMTMCRKGQMRCSLLCALHVLVNEDLVEDGFNDVLN